MGKYNSYIIQKILLFKAFNYYLLLWTIYYTILKRLKIYDSTAVDSSDDDNEMDYLSGSLGSDADW